MSCRKATSVYGTYTRFPIHLGLPHNQHTKASSSEHTVVGVGKGNKNLFAVSNKAEVEIRKSLAGRIAI